MCQLLRLPSRSFLYFTIVVVYVVIYNIINNNATMCLMCLYTASNVSMYSAKTLRDFELDRHRLDRCIPDTSGRLHLLSIAMGIKGQLSAVLVLVRRQVCNKVCVSSFTYFRFSKHEPIRRTSLRLRNSGIRPESDRDMQISAYNRSQRAV